jgi:predicted branched-subunit amino acid permease
MYLNWQLCTLIGLLAGQSLGDIGALGLDFAMSVTFIGLVIPALKSRPMLAAALVAGIVAVLAYPLPNKLGLMAAALSGVIAGLVLETAAHLPVKREQTA